MITTVDIKDKCLSISRWKMLCFALSFLFFTLNAFSEEMSFTASVSSNQVSVGDQLQVTFTVNGNAGGFRPPAFTDFNVLAGPSQSSSVNIINGSVSQNLSITYVLQALKEGTFKIGSAEITAGNKKLTSNPVTINVVKASRQSSGASSGQQQNNGQGNDQASAAAAAAKNVFIRASVDKSSVYRGEAVIVTYQLYTRVTLLNYGLTKIPALNGFWSQDIAVPQQPQFRTEVLDGMQYKVADIKKMVVFPQRSGTLEIDPMEGEVIARVPVKRQQSRSNDPFEQFFNDPFFNNNVQDIKLPIKSESVRLNVKELPANAPASFSGAVGRFTYEVSLDKKEIKSHEPLTLKVKIAGKGNVKLVEAPKVSFPQDFETYDPKEAVSINATTGGITGTKTFEFLVIPRNAGDFKIPVSAFSYFDLDKKQYIEIPAPVLSIHVDKGTETVTTTVSGVSKSDIQFLGKDIRFIKTGVPAFIHPGNSLYGSTRFYVLLGAPCLAFLMLILFRRRVESMNANAGLLKSQRANKVAKKRLEIAKKHLAANQRNQFLDEMSKALWGFVSDKLQIPVSDLSLENTSRALSARNVPEELIAQFNDTINSCEFARFAGSSGESGEEIYKKGLDIISKLEQSVRA